MRQALPAASLIAAGLIFAAPAIAAEVTPPTIIVTGVGRADHPADYAWLNFTLRGEGPASPQAVKALGETQAKVEASLAHLPGKPTVETRGGTLSIRELRGKACENRGFPQSATGDCAVIGHIATESFQVKITPAKRVGDAASLVAQLGGVDVNATGGGVTDEGALNDAAMRDAIADAKRQAQLIATASGVKLGPIQRVQDGQASPIMAYSAAYGAPPPPPPPPPLPIPPVQLASPLDYVPPPITRNARVMVTYGLEP